jgi:DNA invertase Pin-like site-specific DNA recombinase
MTVYGYARVSSKGQTLEAQQEALRRVGCDVVFDEKVSAKAENARPRLAALLRKVDDGDCIVVTKLDRFARSLRDLLNLVSDLGKRGVGFKSIGDSIDTTTPAGRLFLSIVGAFAEFEREVIEERTKAGIARARSKGIKFGPKFKLTEHQKKEIRDRLASGETAVSLSKSYGVSHQTIGRVVYGDLAKEFDVSASDLADA